MSGEGGLEGFSEFAGVPEAVEAVVDRAVGELTVFRGADLVGPFEWGWQTHAGVLKVNHAS